MNRFLKIFELKNAFILSLILGFINWFMFYTILPINTSSLSFETLSFIVCSVTCFITGYFLFRSNRISKQTINPRNYFMFFVVTATIGLTIRYIDFFFIRDIKWSNPFYVNRLLKDSNVIKSNLFLTLSSTLRVLYFIPLLILIVQKSKNKIFWFTALFLIFYCFVEVFLFGTRKPFFYLALVSFIALFYHSRRRFILSKRNILLTISSVVLLGFFSYFILNKRISEDNTANHSLAKVTDARYNDFVKIKEYKLNQIKETPQELYTKTQIMFIHTGQYIVHGFFELDYIVNNDFPKAKGLYSFNPIFKLFNRLSLYNFSLNTDKYHPRDYVYTSFFGSFFIDFGWFAIIFMFLFGAFQRWIFIIAKSNIIAKIFFIVLLSVNVTMPVFNLLSGAGLYLFIFIISIMGYSLKNV